MFAFLTDRQWMWCAAGFYLAGALLGSLSLLRRGRPLGGVMYGLIAIGYVLQLAGLSERGRVDGRLVSGMATSRQEGRRHGIPPPSVRTRPC